MSDAIRLSSVSVNCPDATELAQFYADITGGRVTFSHPAWATMFGPGGRIDFQTVDDYRRPQWPGPEASANLHLDFLVDDLGVAETRALRTVSRPILYLRANARIDNPPTRESRRIAAYNSTLGS